MSDSDCPSGHVNSLTQRLLRAEKSIEFLQKEHSTTLIDLQQELSKWQRKYSDLTVRLTLGSLTRDSTEQIHRQITVEQLEKELSQSRNKVKCLTRVLEEKDKLLDEYQRRLQIRDERHGLDLHKQYHQQRELKTEQQASKIYTRICLGHAILPNKPNPLKSTEDKHPAARLRSSSTVNRTSSDRERARSLFIGRRRSPLQPRAPPTAELKEKQLLTKRQRQLLHDHSGTIESSKLLASRSTIKFSTVLPPITSRKLPLKATLPCEGEA